MTNQVINRGVPSQQPQVQVQQQPVQGRVQPRRRNDDIPMNAVSSSSSSVRMIAIGATNDGKTVVILDSGSNVSLLPMTVGCNVDRPADKAQVQLRLSRART